MASLAFGSHGGTETAVATLPGPGSGTVQTNLPAAVTDATIEVQPTADTQDLDSITDTLITSYPKLGKLSRPAQRFISCAILYTVLAAFHINAQSDLAETSTNQVAARLVLDICRRLAVALTLHHPAVDATPASAVCPRLDRSIAARFSRSGGGYRIQLNGRTFKPRGRSAVDVSCKRKGRGMMIRIRPRARGRTLRQVVGPSLGIAYVNSASKPVGVRTTFTVK